MNPLQSSLELDFTIKNGNMKIHERENSIENESHLKENAIHFTAQCEKVLNILKSGVRLTRKSAMVEYDIMSLERRCADLRALKYEIKTEWVTNEKGKKLYKYYYL